jgi:16S rRNA (uracil1498-N3)-methyltransferase
MASFLVQPQDVVADELTLRGAEAHHVTHVRRVDVGDAVDVVDGQGQWYRGEVTRIAPGEVVCRVLSSGTEADRSGVALCLAAAVIRGPRFDQVIEKATELGVDAIVPVIADRSVAAPGPDRLERWQRVARAAAKQCGRARLPELVAPTRLSTLLAGCGTTWERAVMAVPGARFGSVREVISARASRSYLLLIGPEGGFSPAEEEQAAQAGVECFSWGWTTLRAETACLVLAALVLHEAYESLRRAS